MSWRGRVFDMGNVALKPLGLQLVPLNRDFDNRLLSEQHIAAMLRRTSLEIERFLKDECIFTCPIDFDVEKQVSDFYRDYLTSPYRLPRSHGPAHRPDLRRKKETSSTVSWPICW